MASRFRVVGVFESFSVYENGAVFMLLDDLAAANGPPGQVTGYIVQANPPGDPRAIDALRTKIEALDPEIAATPCAEFVGSLNQMRVTRVMSWVISAVACLMGAFGILNTMAMSVFERRCEIGAFRAMGWRTWRVVVLIVEESLLLAAAGSIVGVAGGFLAVFALAHWHVTSGLVQGDLSLRAVCEGVVMAALMAIVGAAYPASGSHASLRSKHCVKAERLAVQSFGLVVVEGAVVEGAGESFGVRSIIPHMCPPNLSCCHVPA